MSTPTTLATSTPTKTAAGIPIPTGTPPPAWTREPPVAFIRTTPLVVPAGLTVEEYSLEQPPEAEYTLLYFTFGDPRYLHDTERNRIFTSPYCDSRGMTMCAYLGEHRLTAEEVYTSDANYVSSGEVILREDGEEIYRIGVGPGSPLTALQGLWTYAGHWVLEAAAITVTNQGNTAYSNAVGRIILDGQILNETRNYDEAFGFQTLQGRPFYFYSRDGQIGAWYDGTEIPLGYDRIPHYGCCSGAMLNPKRYLDMVAFFAVMQDKWYYVEIGAYGGQ